MKSEAILLLPKLPTFLVFLMKYGETDKVPQTWFKYVPLVIEKRNESKAKGILKASKSKASESGNQIKWEAGRR